MRVHPTKEVGMTTYLLFIFRIIQFVAVKHYLVKL
jgi:hypothetical protein